MGYSLRGFLRLASTAGGAHPHQGALVGPAVESRKALNLLRSTESAPRGRAEHVSEHATRQRLPAAALRLQNNETKGLLLGILATRNSAAGAEQREVF